MIDVNMLDRVNEFHIYLSTKHNDQMKYAETLFSYQKIRDEINTYNLKDCEEVVGTLLLISIDPENPTTGYCLMDLGDELINIIVYDPKIVFSEWDKTKGIVFCEKVAVLRLDEDGTPKFHLRYLSEDIKETSKEITRYIVDYINHAPSKEEVAKRKLELPPDSPTYIEYTSVDHSE